MNPCQNKGTCIQLGDDRSVCKCSSKQSSLLNLNFFFMNNNWIKNEDEYYGEFCQHENPCNSKPCSNGKICKLAANENNYVCSDDGCQTNPCQNDGVCSIDSNSKLECTCKSGFIGSFCETAVNQCDSNPCKNGFCVPSSKGFFCLCDRKLAFIIAIWFF